MTAPLAPLAEVILRSRSGATILDWDEAEPAHAKRFVADPEYLKLATSRLTDLGFTVLSIGPVRFGSKVATPSD